MKKLYVSPDAEYLKIEFIEDVLVESNSTPIEPDTIGKDDHDFDFNNYGNNNARTTF